MARKRLNKKQIMVAEMLADPSAKLTDAQIMELCSVPKTTYYRWLREDEMFVQHINRLVEKYTDGKLASVWRSLVRNIENGDTQAMKLFFELKGKYKQDITVKGGATVEIINDIERRSDNAET